MAAHIPAKLRQAGITTYLLRAAQLETAKPVIAYWCEYWAVNQILSRQLHQADDESLQYTMTLMDKLEQTKATNAENDAIMDDVAGQAYVEQFAQETFDRAQRPLKANKVTQQTAQTFEAASTFFQLTKIWGEPDAEAEQKIKYAKYHAARIMRAIKEGSDPNESNPKQEDELPAATPIALDPNDPEVQAISQPAPPQPATVENAPDETNHAPGHYLDTSAPSAARYSPGPVSAPTSPPHSADPVDDQVSPIAPPDQPANDGYFPSVPGQSGLQLPSAPGAAPAANAEPPSPPTVLPSLGPQSPPDGPQDFYREDAPPPQHQYQPSQPPAVPPTNYYQQPISQQPVVPVHTFSPPPPTLAVQTPPTQAPYRPPPQQPPPPSVQSYAGTGTGPSGPNNTGYISDEMAVAKAQKHAKWAISALNFEDVPTAVKELKAALATLGAR